MQGKAAVWVGVVAAVILGVGLVGAWWWRQRVPAAPQPSAPSTTLPMASPTPAAASDAAKVVEYPTLNNDNDLQSISTDLDATVIMEEDFSNL